jgi:hypothetical protein
MYLSIASSRSHEGLVFGKKRKCLELHEMGVHIFGGSNVIWGQHLCGVKQFWGQQSYKFDVFSGNILHLQHKKDMSHKELNTKAFRLKHPYQY